MEAPSYIGQGIVPAAPARPALRWRNSNETTRSSGEVTKVDLVSLTKVERLFSTETLFGLEFHIDDKFRLSILWDHKFFPLCEECVASLTLKRINNKWLGDGSQSLSETLEVHHLRTKLQCLIFMFFVLWPWVLMLNQRRQTGQRLKTIGL